MHEHEGGLVFDIEEKKFDDDGHLVQSKPKVRVSKFFENVVDPTRRFGTYHPKNSNKSIQERFLQTFGVTYNAEKEHHGCGYVGWFPDWKQVDLDAL